MSWVEPTSSAAAFVSATILFAFGFLVYRQKPIKPYIPLFLTLWGTASVMDGLYHLFRVPMIAALFYSSCFFAFMFLTQSLSNPLRSYISKTADRSIRRYVLDPASVITLYTLMMGILAVLPGTVMDERSVADWYFFGVIGFFISYYLSFSWIFFKYWRLKKVILKTSIILSHRVQIAFFIIGFYSLPLVLSSEYLGFTLPEGLMDGVVLFLVLTVITPGYLFAARKTHFDEFYWTFSNREQLELLKTAIRQSSESIAITDAADRIVFANSSFTELHGYQPSELAGMNLSITYDGAMLKAIQAAEKSGELRGSWSGEMNRLRKDGSAFTALTTVSFLIDARGQRIGTLSISRDITERKNMEERLRESEERLRLLIEYAPDVIFVIDLSGTLIDVNKQAETLTGYSREGVIGKKVFELGLISERDSRRTLELLQNSLHGERTGPAEFELIKKDGSTITLEVSTFPLRREGNVEILGIARDVSERKKAEKALVESQQKFERLFKSQADPAVFADVKDRFEDVNPRFTELFGYTADEVRGKRLDDLLVPEGRKEEAAMLTEKSKEGYVHCETVRKNKDGVLIPVILSAAPIIVNGRFEGCIISYKDITERKFMEETLRDSEEKFRAISNSARDGIILIDNEAKISYWNPAAERIFGYKAEEAIGKEVHHFLLPENLKQRTTEAMRRFMETRTERLDGRTLETVAIRKDGSEFQAELAVSGFQMKGKWQAVGRVSDITERNQMLKKLEEYSQRLEEMVEKRTEELEKAQERLIRTERLATIGQVAAMVGHDLRNPLTGIKGAAYYLKTKPASRKDKKTMEMLSLIEKDVEYSDKIVTDLLEYSREMHLEPTETTPKSLVEKTLSLISAPQDVIIENLTQDQPRMRVDVEKMDRVFVNLIRNAFDAMPKGGKLTIKSRATGSWAVFTFTDTGVGITQDQMEKIWTPFSTTKAKGMGLGLAICKRIVEAHRGRISISSTRAKGTSITVVVPTEQKARTEGGDETWVKPPESSSSTTMKASEKS